MQKFCFVTSAPCGGNDERSSSIARLSNFRAVHHLLLSAHNFRRQAHIRCVTWFCRYISTPYYRYEIRLRQKQAVDRLLSTKPSFIGSQNNCSMLSRKRPASDTLLPLHPAKIPRTARRTFSGGRKSTRAEDTESIGARWIHIFREVWGLAGETFASIANGMCTSPACLSP